MSNLHVESPDNATRGADKNLKTRSGLIYL